MKTYFIVLTLLFAVSLTHAAGTDPTAALSEAARLGSLEGARAAVGDGANINAINKYGSTALMIAAYEGHSDVAGFLIQAGAALDLKDEAYGATALMMAAQQGHESIVRLLLKAGAGVTVRSKKGNTALDQARSQGHGTVVALLSPLVASPSPDNSVRPMSMKTTTVTNAYDRELHTTLNGYISYPSYNGALEIGREIKELNAAGQPKGVVKAFSGYRWNSGQLTRSVEDRRAHETYVEVRDAEGRTMAERRHCGAVAIEVQYEWEGAGNNCATARALSGKKVLGEAKVVGAKANNDGYSLEVEETHYATNGDGTVIYKCRSTFNYGYTSRVLPFTRIEETALSGKKTCELFPRWGSTIGQF